MGKFWSSSGTLQDSERKLCLRMQKSPNCAFDASRWSQKRDIEEGLLLDTSSILNSGCSISTCIASKCYRH
ncbi:hypothetical protein ABKN59_008110 [Abortiporus biennis]